MIAGDSRIFMLSDPKGYPILGQSLNFSSGPVFHTQGRYFLLWSLCVNPVNPTSPADIPVHFFPIERS